MYFLILRQPQRQRECLKRLQPPRVLGIIRCETGHRRYSLKQAIILPEPEAFFIIILKMGFDKCGRVCYSDNSFEEMNHFPKTGKGRSRRKRRPTESSRLMRGAGEADPNTSRSSAPKPKGSRLQRRHPLSCEEYRDRIRTAAGWGAVLDEAAGASRL